MKRLAEKLELTGTARRMCLSIFALYGGLLVLGLLVGALFHPFEQPASYVLGLSLGCALSLVKVVLLERGIRHLLDAEKGWAQWLAVFHTLLRYLLTAGVLACAFAFSEIIGVFGAVFGVLTLPVAAHIAGRLPDDQPLS